MWDHLTPENRSILAWALTVAIGKLDADILAVEAADSASLNPLATRRKRANTMLYSLAQANAPKVKR